MILSSSRRQRILSGTGQNGNRALSIQSNFKVIKSSDNNGISFTRSQLDVSVHPFRLQRGPVFKRYFNQGWKSFSMSCSDEYYEGPPLPQENELTEWNLEAMWWILYTKYRATGDCTIPFVLYTRAVFMIQHNFTQTW